MKNTQKKLKAKHFRYLSRKEIKDPLSYLKYHFVDVTTIALWSRDVTALLQSSIDKRLTLKGYPYVSIGQDLIKHVEIAYVIYVNCRIKHLSQDCMKVNSNLSRRNHFEKERLYRPEEILYLFFSFQPLQRWREEIDWMTHKAFADWTGYKYEPEKNSMIHYVYITELIYALYQIYEEDGVELEFPEYIKPKIRNDSESFSTARPR